LPDLINEFTEIDLDETLSPEEKDKKKTERQQHCDEQAERIHNISQLLRPTASSRKMSSTCIEDNKVVIVDEFTGRKMPGRRWERVDCIRQLKRRKASRSIVRPKHWRRSRFKLFQALSKTGGNDRTAETEAAEFHDIYKLDVNMIRRIGRCGGQIHNDRIYKTRPRKIQRGSIKEIREAHAKNQPVLVGSVSVEASELLSRMLKREKIPHNVLKRKFNMQEAEIVARAGQPGTVTISTNMAGRGTDIKLGPGVIEAGGLMVVWH